MEQKKELNSLNTQLPPLYLEELEQRLETDPLAIGGLLSADWDADSCTGQCNGQCNGQGNHCTGQCNEQCNEHN